MESEDTEVLNVFEKVVIHVIVILLGALIVIALFFIIVIPMNYIDVAVQPNVEVFVNKELMYKGTNACVHVESSGDTTTVNTRRFHCILPDKTYTSKDVVIRTVE